MRELITLIFIVVTSFSGAQCDSVNPIDESIIALSLNMEKSKAFLNYFYSLENMTINKEFILIENTKDIVFFKNLIEGREYKALEFRIESGEQSSWKFNNFNKLNVFWLVEHECEIYGVICPSTKNPDTLVGSVNLSGIESRYLIFRIRDELIEFEF